MRGFGIFVLLMAGCAIAQQPAPFINADGIVRGDTNRPGLAAPGVVISIYGHGFGPAAGCIGHVTELCGVSVLLDGQPIEIQFVKDVQINARIPDVPPPPVSQLVVTVDGRPSDPVRLQRAPEPIAISIEGTPRVDGPVWIDIRSPHRWRVAYPSFNQPGNFACDGFEVRRDGKTLAPISVRLRGMGGSLPSCPGYFGSGSSAIRTDRLPLHLQYRFDAPGRYEVRYSHYNFFSRGADELRYQSDWTPFEVLPAVARRIGEHPRDPATILNSFLPDVLARRDDERWLS